MIQKASDDAAAAAELDAAAALEKANLEAKAKAEREAKAEQERSAGSASSVGNTGTVGSAGSAGRDSKGCQGSFWQYRDTIATVDAATKAELMGLNMTLDVHFRRNMVLIQMSGPSDKWIGISFGATLMSANPYAIVWEENRVSERMLREYSAGLKLKNSSMTYIESCVKTTPSRRRAWSSGVVLRRNICMRPIEVAGANDTYYSFAKLKDKPKSESL